MTKELKQKAERFIESHKINKYMVSLVDLLTLFATEATKELQEELEDTNILYRNSEKEKCELLGIIQSKDKVIKQLQEEIEKMKCCNNCKYRCYMDWKSKCCFDITKIRDIENPVTCKCDKWEIER